MAVHRIAPGVTLDDEDVAVEGVRASGPGGQNVNKVSSAVQLRFDIRASSLPDNVKERLLALQDQRVTKDGVIVIKAQTSRSQDRNRAEAMERLQLLVDEASHTPKPRRPTRPSLGAKKRRMQAKTIRSQVKANRAKVDE
jgi:ribosome-associated protein